MDHYCDGFSKEPVACPAERDTDGKLGIASLHPEPGGPVEGCLCKPGLTEQSTEAQEKICMPCPAGAIKSFTGNQQCTEASRKHHGA